MSLTDYLRREEVISLIRDLRPKETRQIGKPVKIEPRSNRYILVGRAFDYMLRFEIKRRVPTAISKTWFAEVAPSRVYMNTEEVEGDGILANEVIALGKKPKKIAESMTKVLNEAKKNYQRYLQNPNPSRSQKKEMASFALILGNLESIARGGKLFLDYDIIHNEDAEDIIDLLELVPFDEVINQNKMLLNPTFGEYSRIFRGADADLISGESLIDFKVTKKKQMEVADLDQILGYFIIAGEQRKSDLTIPEIKRVGLYFARHGFLWTYNTENWLGNTSFPQIKKQFIEHARDVYDMRK